ncbi:unnamed protein product [Anisakis simplex]|uniref:Uncharacterized protein n=1 Tax=Anisakis simplex TaxID=6269 RepID=A0A3P6TDE5_ANISI|nr:unnamed protein product [Anisakis simplex]
MQESADLQNSTAQQRTKIVELRGNDIEIVEIGENGFVTTSTLDGLEVTKKTKQKKTVKDVKKKSKKDKSTGKKTEKKRKCKETKPIEDNDQQQVIKSATSSHTLSDQSRSDSKHLPSPRELFERFRSFCSRRACSLKRGHKASYVLSKADHLDTISTKSDSKALRLANWLNIGKRNGAITKDQGRVRTIIPEMPSLNTAESLPIRYRSTDCM